ncbi:MAG: N-acylneuraminate cytidylyltransferase [Bdellovibrionota bacterium]
MATIAKSVALIPMRGGSKSIPKKNIKSIAGKPLFWWATSAALDSAVFDHIYVSTDSPEIETCVHHFFGESVTTIRRDASLATDEASTESVMLDFASKIAFETITLIQVTSPLVQASDFRKAHQTFKANHLDSLLTATEFKRFLWSRDAVPINYDPKKRPRRQDFTPYMLENGAFYITKKEILETYKSRLAGQIGIHKMREESSVEIDEPQDWEMLENLLLKQKTLPNLKDIKCLMVDVDGTLTDGGMYYSAEGEVMKKFVTKDAQGMNLLESKGIQVCVITAESSSSVHARMKKIGIKHYFHGIKNKKSVVDQWLKDQPEDMTWKDIAYIGDDLGDLECLQHAGQSFCPADADPIIKKNAYTLSSKGGEGAVRELCNLILEAQDLALSI